MLFRKIFSELRFSVQPDILDNKGVICKSLWPKYFSHWQLNDNTIRFSNKENQKEATEILIVTPNRILYIFENPINDNYIENYKNYLSELKKWIYPVKYDRVGIRIYSFIQKINFDEYINNAVKGKIFNNDFLKKFLLKNKIEDIAITLENKNTRITFGPMRKSESNIYLEEIISKEILVEEFLFIDIDCFDKNIDQKDLTKTLYNLFLNAKENPSCFI